MDSTLQKDCSKNHSLGKVVTGVQYVAHNTALPTNIMYNFNIQFYKLKLLKIFLIPAVILHDFMFELKE
jgi:hypothetical protein